MESVCARREPEIAAGSIVGGCRPSVRGDVCESRRGWKCCYKRQAAGEDHYTLHCSLQMTGVECVFGNLELVRVDDDKGR